MELVRQPIFLLLTSATAVFEVFLSCVNYFAFGDEPKLVKNSALAVMFFSGLFGTVLSASAAVAREIRTGTALAVLAKPVGRAQFLLAKFCGIAAALSVMVYINLIGALFASRMAFDSYGDVDFPALGLFSGGIILAYAIAGFSNFFLRRPFMADAVISVVVMLTLAFLVSLLVKKPVTTFTPEGAGLDLRLIPAALLVLFALWILAALALACSTRLEILPTLAICSALFLLGLMSDYFLGKRVEAGSWWASVLYSVTPNWQLFWLGDLLEGKKTLAEFPWSYVAKAFGYVVGYGGALLAIALVLFEDRELT